MTILSNKLKFTSILTLLMCLTAISNTAFAITKCGTGTLNMLAINEDSSYQQINKENNLHFKLSDNSEFWINNYGDEAGNTIFTTLENALLAAYVGNITIEVWTRFNNGTCTGGKNQNDYSIRYPYQNI